jgi:NADH:ubiquinone oxidoreductase subunit 4 (subunit M)
LSPREWFVIAPICALAIVMGVVPSLFLRPMEPAVKKNVQSVVGVQTSGNAKAAPADSPGQVAVDAAVARVK